jgi:hypothetical protein
MKGEIVRRRGTFPLRLTLDPPVPGRILSQSEGVVESGGSLL